MSYKFQVTKTQESSLSKVDFNNIPFGKTFSDHMFVADYIDGHWTNMEIRPVAPIPTHPGNMAWHYGQEIFEGMKAPGMLRVLRSFTGRKNTQKG